MWSLHVLLVSAWLLSRYSGFLPQSKGMQVRLTGNSKLAQGEKAIVDGCFSHWPCNELVTCPECNPIFTPRRLGWAPAALWPEEAQLMTFFFGFPKTQTLTHTGSHHRLSSISLLAVYILWLFWLLAGVFYPACKPLRMTLIEKKEENPKPK